ncbi:hypothetical protein CBS101457_003611 [Exobasidium rhododendri]|nr:hypothetical protein CBS101457_003611 [Exobasidium rhododendri]
MAYHMSPRTGRDSAQSRPMTPGTPGTFDTSFGSQELDRYDDPNGGQRSPQMGNRDTYYFNKEGGAAATGAGAGAAAGAGVGARASRKNWFRRHPWICGLIALIIVAAAVGGGVGGALGGSGSKNSDLASKGSNTGSGSTTGKSGSTSSKGSGSSSSSSNSTTTNTTSTPAPIVALAKWNLTDPNTKMVGTSLGNWLVLERWMDEDWFVGVAGDDAWDEWSFTQSAGPTKALSALQEHWNTWVLESDIDTLKSIGINSVRIPIGYWAFVPVVSGEPYLAQSGQTEQLQKVLGWLYDRGMYAMIDLHGMPGSQNGDQSSGHNTTNPTWFTDANIGYSYTVLNATIAWIQASNYSSVVHSVCPVNEPHGYSDTTKLATITSYYESAYTMLKNAGLIMMFHNAFATDPMSYWQSFVTGKDPNYIAYNDNPYPGWFVTPPVTVQSTVINSVCAFAQDSVGYPVPVVMTEYSAINSIGTSFNEEYYNTQLSAYAWSGGSFFWNFKTNHSTIQVLAVSDLHMDQYSLTTLAAAGSIQTANTSQTSLQQINALSNQECGAVQSQTFTNPSTEGTAYSASSSSRRSSNRAAKNKKSSRAKRTFSG